MLEVEVKYAAVDFGSLETTLQARGARFVEERRDADHYLNAPDRDFRQTDEALRLRSVGDRNLITYKGPSRGDGTKSREEIELPLPDGDRTTADFLQMFGRLGYTPSPAVRKTRRVWEWPRDDFALHVCLDEVDGVGKFAELEVMAEEADYERARAAVLAAAAELGLTEVERRAYVQLVLARGEQA